MAAISRRAVLLTLGGVAGVVVAGVGASVVVCNARSEATALSLERLDVALAEMPGAARIARAVRAATEQAELIEQFIAKRPLVSALAIDCPASRLQAINAQIRADFDADDVVVADRWVVSRSECLIAALCPAGGYT